MEGVRLMSYTVSQTPGGDRVLASLREEAVRSSRFPAVLGYTVVALLPPCVGLEAQQSARLDAVLTRALSVRGMK